MEFVTDAAIEGYLNIEGLATKYTTAGQSVSALTVVKANADSVIKSHMPEKRRRMMRTICGLRLTDNASEGQTTFTLPAAVWVPDADQSYIWVNLCGAYRDRDRNDSVSYDIAPVLDEEDAVIGYTVTLDEGLTEGDVVVMDVTHSGENPPNILKKLALDVAVNELVTRKPALCNDPILRDMFTNNYRDAREMLKDMLKGKLRIDEWDELSLVAEHESATPEGPGTMIVGW